MKLTMIAMGSDGIQLQRINIQNIILPNDKIEYEMEEMKENILTFLSGSMIQLCLTLNK